MEKKVKWGNLNNKWVAPETRDTIVEELKEWQVKTELPLLRMLSFLSLDSSRFYDWQRRFGASNKHNGQQPKDSWILPEERQAIIDFYLKNPLNGCKRLSYMMIDEDVAYVSHNTVHRVLSSEGLLSPSSRSKA